VSRRIGVAIAIPEPYGGELQRWRKEFGDPLADAIPTHVTLLPPSEIPEEELAEVDRHLRTVARWFRPFEVQLRGTGAFRPVSPVVFVSLARGAAECELLASRVRSGPLTRQIEFAYHPHVTVAHDLPDEGLDRAFEELSAYVATFLVWGFSMYEHGPDAVWRPRRDYAFVGGVSRPGA
jgi:2'-5' RNA ligase